MFLRRESISTGPNFLSFCICSLLFGEKSLEYAYVKVPLGPEFWYSIFLHFRKQSAVVNHHAKFQLITTTGSCFFRTVFVEILRPPLLALVPEAGLRISGSDVRGSPQT